MGYNDEFSGQIVIDIETVASPDAAALLDPVKPPANYKDPAKIAAYCEEKRSEQIARAALEADLCEIVAVGWHVYGQHQTFVMTREHGTEAECLDWFLASLAGRLCVGFNILNFDLPVLMRRAQLLGLKYPTLSLDRYRSPHIDLLERLSFNGRLTYRSLAFYCRRFGIPVEDQTQGADIAALVTAGNWESIGAHCEADVDKTVKLAEKLGWLKAAWVEV